MSDKQIIMVTDKKGFQYFSITFPYDQKLIEYVKKIPNRTYHSKTTSWRIRADHITAKYIESFSRKLNFELDSESQQYINTIINFNHEIKLPTLKRELRNFQKEGVKYAVKYERCFIADEQGLGKAQSLYSKILTPNGWKLMKNIKMGDEIINSDGNISNVTGIYPQGKIDMYEVMFNDKSKTIVSDNHLWAIQSANYRHRNKGYVVKELKEFKNNLKNKYGNNWYIPMVKPINFKEISLKIDPYIMGVLLGDEGLTFGINFTNIDEDIISEVSNRLPSELKLTNYDIMYKIIKNDNNRNYENSYIKEFKKLGLFGKKSNEKFIPMEYKINSINNRFLLLQGLLDTRGSITKDGSIVEYYTTSKKLCDDVKFIVQSLGGNAKEFNRIPKFKYKNVEKIGHKCFILRIKLDDIFHNKLFKCKRKLDRVHYRKTKYGNPYRVFKSIKYIGKMYAQCISTNATDKLYVTDDCILTHNTVESIASVEALNAYPCLVICPASLKLNWKKEVSMWTNRTSHVIQGFIKTIYDDVKNKKIVVDHEIPEYSGDFIIINFDILYRVNKIQNKFNPNNVKIPDHKDYLKKYGFKSIIIDESQLLSGHKSLRTKAVKEVSRQARYRFALSGTPILNKPKELIPQLDILDRLNDFGGFWTFAKEYCNAVEGPFGWDLGGASNLNKLHENLKKICFIRRLKTDVLDELPEKQRILFPVEQTNYDEYKLARDNFKSWMKINFSKESEIYEKLKSIKELTDSQRRIVAKANATLKLNKTLMAEALVKIEKLKQIVARGKLNSIYSLVDNFLEYDDKIIIFAKHEEIYKKLIDTYKNISVHIIGGMSPKLKQESVDRFQSDDNIRIFIGALDAAGVGLTLTKASTVIHTELGWTSAIHDQADDRAHRIGQKNFVKCYYTYCENTIEEKILDLIEHKRSMSANILDGKTMSDDNADDNDVEYLISNFI